MWGRALPTRCHHTAQLGRPGAAQTCHHRPELGRNQNRRLTSENANLFTRLEELAGNAGLLQKIRIQLGTQLDDAKRMCDDEAKERQSLLGRFRTLEHEYDGVKEHFEDELQQKTEAGRQLQKEVVMEHKG